MDKREGIPISSVAQESIAADLGIAAGIIAGNRWQETARLDRLRLSCCGEYKSSYPEKIRCRIYIQIERNTTRTWGWNSTPRFSGLIEFAIGVFFVSSTKCPGNAAQLYIKDDDYRLSFLDGSFITLTNLGPRNDPHNRAALGPPLYLGSHYRSPSQAQVDGQQEGRGIKDQLERLAGAGIDFMPR